MPASPLHLLRVNARELLRVPGTSRAVAAELDGETLGLDDARIIGPIDIALDAVSNIDGVVVHGTVSVPWTTQCRRCLTTVNGTEVIDVDEVYQDVIVDEDAFAIEGDQIDMAPAVREYVMIELPDGPLCRNDCAGICPVCGVDRNEATCGCDTTVRDHRWAALDDLKLDD